MAIEISEKIRFYGKEAIEDRLNVATIEDRNNIPLNERYNGMITTVRSEGKRYELLFDGDFEGLNETEKDAFLGNNDNWKITNATLESDIITVVTRSWGKDGKLSFKAILDDDIGIKEWEAARIYVIPHNDGYYHGEVSPMFYVGKIHRFLKGDTEGGEEKGDIEAGSLEAEEIKGAEKLEIRNNKPVKFVFRDPRHPDSEFMGNGQKVLAGVLVAGIGENFDEYGYDESDFPIKRPSYTKLGMVGGGENGTIYAEFGISSPRFEGNVFFVSATGDNVPAAIEFRDEDEDHSFGTAKIFAEPDGTEIYPLKYQAKKHIFEKNTGPVDEPGDIETGTLKASGDITAFSDKRIKANIKPITNALDKIKKIQGVSYTRKDQADKKKKHIGLIAQDLLEVVPEVVKVPEKEKEMHSVDYSKLTALLIEGIKEQQKEIELLKGEINLMKGGK